MSASPPPIVYSETPWLVSLALPHHPSHAAALALRDAAARSECEVRVPYASLLELGGAIQRTTGALQQSITNIEDAVSAAVQNGRVELGSLLAAIQSSSFNDYLSAFTRAKNKAGADLPATVRAFVDDIRQRPGVSFLRELPFDEMDAIRSEVNFTGADLADFYILASIVRDRAKEPDRAAVFCSLDRREFKNKASADFYDRRRITFRPNFDFRTGIGAWQNDFASPSK